MAYRDSRFWLVLAFVLSIATFIYLLSPILSPFVIGILLAYLGDPVVDRLEKLNISRSFAVVIVFLVLLLVFILLILLLFPMLQSQIAGFFARLPQYAAWLDQRVDQLVAFLELGEAKGSTATFKELAIEYLPQAGSATRNIFKLISSSGGFVLSGVLATILTPVVTFYFLRDWDHLVTRFRDLVPLSMRSTVNALASESDSVLSAFLRGQFLVMIALGSIYATGLTIIGLQFALLVGFAAGILSFIPYLGTLTGLLIAGILFLVQNDSWFDLWKIGTVFIVGQSLEGYLLTPWLVGDRIGLHPVAVIFAVLAGGQLFGFVGVLLALPMAAVLAVLIRFTLKRYFQSEVYNRPEKSAE